MRFDKMNHFYLRFFKQEFPNHLHENKENLKPTTVNLGEVILCLPKRATIVSPGFLAFGKLQGSKITGKKSACCQPFLFLRFKTSSSCC